MEKENDKATLVLAMIRQCLEKAGSELQGRQVVLFGSRAVGRAGARSDFDIGVTGEKPLPLDIFYRIEEDLENLPTLFSIDWVDLNRVSPEFRARALLESIVIYG